MSDCCPCETAEQRYARWDREASEAKAAALANPDAWISVSDEAAGIERQLETMIVGDPDQPGDTEEGSDYTYETVSAEPRRSDYDAYAKELAADSKAEDYPDPAIVAPPWALTS